MGICEASNESLKGSTKPGQLHAQKFRDRVAADPDHRRDLVAAMAANVFEAEDFSNLTHQQSLAWHGAPRVPGSEPCHRRTTARDPPYQPLLRGSWNASEWVAGFRRNHRLEWIGIVGWFAPEYAMHRGRGASLMVMPRRDGRSRGVFATRAPCRPNPIALSVVAFEGFDGSLRLKVHNLDCVNQTPPIDLRPYISRTDAEPTARMGWIDEAS